MKKVNLHVHTSFSDGDENIDAVVARMRENEVDFFAVTDHDTVDGLLHVLQNNWPKNMISGVELSSYFEMNVNGKRELMAAHILGYDFDIDKMREYTLKWKTNRRNGIPSPTPSESIVAIKECGGFSIWAHPFRVLVCQEHASYFVRFKRDSIRAFAKKLTEFGLSGLEAEYYDGFSDEQRKFLHQVVNEYGLLYSIGTDIHFRANRNNILFVTLPIEKNCIIAKIIERNKE